LPERLRPIEPLTELLVVGPVRELPPMIEGLAVDGPDSAQLLTKLALLLGAHDGNSLPPGRAHHLHGHPAEPPPPPLPPDPRGQTAPPPPPGPSGRPTDPTPPAPPHPSTGSPSSTPFGCH